MTSTLIDIHAHLEDEKFSEDVRETIERAMEAGVNQIINVGCSMSESEKVIKISQEYPQCYCLVGVHPHNAKEFNDVDLAKIEEYTKLDKVLGIGEIGLDYFYDFAPKELQIEVFQKQWKLAASLDVPVELHIRDAYEDFFPAISNLPAPTKKLLHCFSGDLEIAKKALDLGFEFSIGGVLTFPKSEVTREVFRYIPVEKIHLETDCPYLAPQGKRGKRNEPANVSITIETLAKVKNLSVAELSEILIDNAHRFFGKKLGFV